MTQPQIRRIKPGRGALALFASAALIGGLAFTHTTSGAVHAQGAQATPTASTGAPPPPPPPPPPPAAATTTRPAAPPPPPPPPAATTARPAGTPAATAARPTAQAPAAPKAQAPVARPALPNTGTGGVGSDGNSPLLPAGVGVGVLALIGGSVALRRNRKS